MKCIDQRTGENWTAYHGDCVEIVASLPSESIGYSIYSPPFASLYTYSNSERDMGNCRNNGEFFENYRFLIDQILRATKPGRLSSVHCMNLPTSKARHGFIGIEDFRGRIIREHEEAGWIITVRYAYGKIPWLQCNALRPLDYCTSRSSKTHA